MKIEMAFSLVTEVETDDQGRIFINTLKNL